jgi:hypothetical protein
VRLGKNWNLGTSLRNYIDPGVSASTQCRVILNNTRITIADLAALKLKINWEHRRVKHAIERMWLRGISVRDVEEAVLKGKKVLQRETGLTEAFFRRFSVVYDEKVYRKMNLRKVFPVTVKVL